MAVDSNYREVLDNLKKRIDDLSDAL